MKFTRIVKPLNKLSMERMKAAFVIAVMNHKGGCGKSSIVDALAHVLVRMGFRVLMIDNDPQCNLTQRLGIVDYDDNDIKRVDSLYNSIVRENYMAGLEDLPINISYPENRMRENRFDTTELGVLGLIAGSPDSEIYAGIAKRLKQNKVAVMRFKEMIAFYKQYYDFIIIDTAPSIHDNAINELTVAGSDKMVIPFDGSEAALGIGLFLRWLKYADEDEKHSPVFVLSKYQADTKDVKTAITGDPEIQFENEDRCSVFRAFKKLMGSHVCSNGIQELRIYRSHTFMGMDATQRKQYVKVIKELLHKLVIPRGNSINFWMDNKVQDKLMKEIGLIESSRQRNVPIDYGKFQFNTYQERDGQE